MNKEEETKISTVLSKLSVEQTKELSKLSTDEVTELVKIVVVMGDKEVETFLNMSIDKMNKKHFEKWLKESVKQKKGNNK